MIFRDKPELIVELTADHAQIAKEMDDIWLYAAGLRLGASIPAASQARNAKGREPRLAYLTS